MTMQTRAALPQVAAPAVDDSFSAPSSRTRKRMGVAYAGIVLFILVYFVRPGDWIPGVAALPIEKVVGGIAAVSALVGALGQPLRGIPRQMKLLAIFFLDLCITVPFAHWRGGAFQIVAVDLSKIVVITVAIYFVVADLERLRRLLFIQAAAISAMAWLALLLRTYNPRDGRLIGVVGGVFGNSNDFAISMALSAPFCILFLYRTKKLIPRFFWMLMLGGMLVGTIETASRSGIFTLALTMFTSLWYFGRREQRKSAIGLMIAAVIAVFCLSFTSQMHDRMAGWLEEDSAKAENEQSASAALSADSRRDLLKRSIEVSLQHPILGVGPGNFVEFSGVWHVAHNSYTELSAEAGFPGLLLFLGMLIAAIHNLTRVHRTADDPQVRAYSAVVRSSLLGYCLAAVFASTEYQFFPYFLVAYASVLAQLTRKTAPATTEAAAFAAWDAPPAQGDRALR